jgi:hypothetical protein
MQFFKQLTKVCITTAAAKPLNRLIAKAME